jgi:hypothetical protein
MPSETPAPARPEVLVVGSFPPVSGPAAAAALAAVRRAWAAGDEVVTASLRPAGADLVARVAGPAAGWHLERARRAAGELPRLVLGLEPGQLAPTGGVAVGVGRKVMGALATTAGVLGLARALSRFDQVTVVLAGPLGLPTPLLKVVWRNVGSVVVPRGSEDLAASQRVPESLITWVEPYDVTPAVSGVTPVGPKEVLPRDLPVVLLGLAGRRLLGERFYQVRFQAIRVARRAKRQVAKLRS